MTIPHEAFLSHSSMDQDFVTHLAEVLRRHGVPIWYSRTNILGAQQWHDEIGAALKRCDWFLLVLSPHSVASMWVKRELIFALQQNRFENRIVPLLYQPCDFERLSWVLPSFQIIDFQRAFAEGCRELLRLWGLGYQPSR
jgi:TIR domain